MVWVGEGIWAPSPLCPALTLVGPDSGPPSPATGRSRHGAVCECGERGGQGPAEVPDLRAALRAEPGGAAALRGPAAG